MYTTNADKKNKQENIDVSTMLRNRSKNLENIGINIRAMIRQDRLLHDHLGIEKKYLRSIADFRTKQRFHVAGQEGSVIDSMAYDKWISCFHDKRDEYKTHKDHSIFTSLFWLRNEPHDFDGGDFTLSDYGTTIPCLNNTGVVFLGAEYHEVSPVVPHNEEFGGRHVVSLFHFVNSG